MNQHDALLAAVCAAPDDDLPRLVMADWLDDHGDPERAEFIRTQIEIANGATGKRLTALQKRETVLLGLHSGAWTADLKRFTDDHFADPLRFRRGFVEDISISGELLEEHGDELFAAAPIRTFRMHDQDVEDLHKCKHLLWITTLELTGCALDEEYRHTAKFFRSRVLANLTTLVARGFDDNGHLDAAALKALVGSKHLNKLRRLDIGHNWLFNTSPSEHPEMTRLLMALGNLPSLTDLTLAGIGLPTLTVVELAAQPWLARLTALDLRGNEAGDAGARALGESPHLENVQHFDLRDNEGYDRETGESPLSSEVKRLLKRRFGKRVIL